MTNPPVVPPASPAPLVAKPEPTDSYYLQQIAEHLQSIRSMLKFFTFITVMWIVFSVMGALLSF